MRRVVVTGMGMVTPLGRDLETTWSALLDGKSGVGPISLFDARTFPDPDRRRSPDFRLDDYLDDRRPLGRALPEQPVRPGRRDHGRQGFGLARDQARVNRKRFGVYLGSGEGQQDFPRFVSLVARCTPRRPRRYRPNSPAWASRSCTRSARPSKSRERPPATWRASSGPRAPTPTA